MVLLELKLEQHKQLEQEDNRKRSVQEKNVMTIKGISVSL
jgi:hypothetical protein